jgi:replicative DNA helicase
MESSTSVIVEETNIDVKAIPYDSELEQNILGSIILEDKLMKNVVDTITVNHFYVDLHKKIYSAMLYLHYKNVKIGYETLINRLIFKEKDGYADYVISLGGLIINSKRFESQVELLKDIYQKRVLYKLYKKRLTEDISGIASVELVKEVEDAITNMGISSNLEYEEFGTYIDTWVEQLEDTTPVEQFKLGYKKLDELVLLERSNFMLIGARPSVGKSAFALNLVKNFCLQGRHPLFISLEMNRKEFMNRLVANMGGVKAQSIKRKEGLTSRDWSNIMSAKDEIRKFKFNFYDKGGMTIEQLMGFAKHLKKKGELDVLVIDYLQLLTSNQYRNQKQNQVSYISQMLKQLAMELDIPVIALSQLSRGSIEGGKPRKPVLSDLRDSGSLEQDSNIVLMLHTDDMEQNFKDERFVKMYVRKNRDGMLGAVDYGFKGDYVEFVEKEWINGVPHIVEQEDLSGKTINDGIPDLPF